MTTPRRKSLLQLIEQIEAEAKPSTVPQHRAAILRQRDEIADAIEKGNSLRIIWQALHGAGRVKMSYNYFRQLLISNKIWTPKKGTNKPVEEPPATAAQAAAEAAGKDKNEEFVPPFPIIRSKFLYNSNFGVADPYGKRKKPCDDKPSQEPTPSKEENKAVEEPAAPAPADEPEPEIKLIRSHFLSNTNFGVADPYGEQEKKLADKPAQEPAPSKEENKAVEETPATAQAAAEAAKKEEDDEPHFKIYRSTFLSNTNFGVADPYGKRKKPCDDKPAKELAAPKEGNSPVEEPAATTQAEAPKDDDEPHFKIYRSSFLADTYPNFGVADPYGKRKKPCDDKPAQEPATPKEENKAAPSPAPQYEPKPERFIADAYPNFRATKRDDSDKE